MILFITIVGICVALYIIGYRDGEIKKPFNFFKIWIKKIFKLLEKEGKGVMEKK